MSNAPAQATPRTSDGSSHSNGSAGAHGTNSTRPLAPIEPPAKSSVVSTMMWLIFAALLGVAGYYRATWWPKVEAYLGTNKPPAAKPARVVPVSAAVVRKRDMPLYLNGLGTVTAFKTVTLRSRVEGELVKVAFEEGQMVKEGDFLAEIDPRPFEVQLAQAEAQLARDGATLKTARQTLNRYEGLLTSKSVAAQQYDDQVALVQQTMAAMQSDEAMIATAKLQLTYSRIESPISGRIGLRLVDPGNIVRANDPMGLAVITQLQPIALVFTIPQDDISRVQKRLQTEKTLTVDAFDRDFKLKLASGELLAIDNQVDATTGTVRIKAKFENEDGMLFPNQFVNARLLVDTKPDAIVVPSAAVQRGPTSMFVYVIKSDETVELRNVTTGPTEGAETSIITGLEPGETVVTDGIDKLQPGAKISTRKPGDKKDGEKKDGEKSGDKPKQNSGEPSSTDSPSSARPTPLPEKGEPKAPIYDSPAPTPGPPLTKSKTSPTATDPEDRRNDPLLEPAARPDNEKQSKGGQ